MLIINNIKGYGALSHISSILIDDTGHARIIQPNDIPNEIPIINGKNYALLPGWMDTHIHGNVGHDFADSELSHKEIEKIAEAIGQSGVAFFMPTIVSLSFDKLKITLRNLDNYIARQQQNGAKPGIAEIIGIHLEGPFIAKNCNGAHDINVLQTKINQDMVLNLINEAPHVTAWKITLAPELDGAIQFIQDCKKISEERNIAINIFIGHTNADEHFLQKACAAGAIGFTHLGNANCEKAHRLPSDITHDDLKSNVVKFALNPNNAKKNSYFELIADGYHLSASFVNFALNGRENNAILITDALGPTGLHDGDYHLGDLAIEKKGEVFYLKNTNTLAGSAATLATIAQKFSQMIGKENEELWEILYHSLVVNPRKTTLRENVQLDDQQNFTLIDQRGNLILSVCNGKTIQHKNISTKYMASKQGYFVTKAQQPITEDTKEATQITLKHS